jgi:hypothetical protein
LTLSILYGLTLNVTEEEMGFSLNPLHDISSALHAGERVVGKVLHAGEKVAEDGAKGFASAMKDAGEAVSHMSPSQIGHTALNIVGMVPVVGTVANLANAGWYAAQGDWTDAAWSAAAAIPIEGDVADAAQLGKDALNIAEDGATAGRVAEDGAEVASTAEAGTKAARDGKEVASSSEDVKTGETAATKTGKAIHKELADARRASGDFDLVNEPLADSNGVPIKVPKRVNLETGEPSGSDVQVARPDEVRFGDKTIGDDKPSGRPIAKDRQEMIRFIKAYETREGELPESIEIHRYDPKTGQPDGTERFKPSDFLSKER